MSKTKRGKQPDRRRGRTRPTLDERPPAPMSVTIAAHPVEQVDGRLRLGHDVELVKAAALYADEVELLSPAAAMLVDVAQHRGATDSKRLWSMITSFSDEELERMAPGPWGSIRWRQLGADILEYPEVAEQFGLGELIAELAEQMEAATNETSDIATDLLEGSGVDELLPFVEAGVLRVSNFEGADTMGAVRAAADLRDGLSVDDHGVDLAVGWLGAIRSRLEDGRTRLLFDDATRTVAREVLFDGNDPIQELAAKLAGEASVGAGLLARLDSFPNAPADEILDLRKRLNVARLRYRRAVARFAEQLPSGLDAVHPIELERLWQSEVRPALAELEETLRDSGYVRSVLRTTRDEAVKMALGSSGIYVGLQSITSLHEAASLVASAGTTAASASLVALRDSRTALRESRTHDLYYLHATNEALQ